MLLMCILLIYFIEILLRILVCCRGYPETKLQENLDAEIFGVLLEEARESFDEEIVVELCSEKDDDVESNCARVSTWVESWKHTQTENQD